jgi:hypothetical protein
MVEENSVASVNIVSLSIIHGDPISVELGNSVWRSRIEGRGLALGTFLHEAVELRRGRLVEARVVLKTGNPHRLKQTQGAQCIGISGIFRVLERYLYVTLSGQVVDFVGLYPLHDAG